MGTEKKALFCWEYGDGSGHVIPYLSLIEGLIARGWSVAVAARNTAEIGVRVRAAGASLYQAPVSMGIFPELDLDAASSAESLLKLGYGHEDLLDGVFTSWRSLISLIDADLVIASYAPTALLAAQSLAVPAVMIGSGFDCPVAANPAPLLTPWKAGIEQRLAASEDRVLSTINSVLQRHRLPRRKFALDLYQVPTLLCTWPALDFFAEYRLQTNNKTEYLGSLPAATSANNANHANRANRANGTSSTANTGELFADDSIEGVNIFAYLRNSPQVEPLLSALVKYGDDRDKTRDDRTRGGRTLVYCPNATSAQKQKWHARYAGSLHFAERAVNIAALLSTPQLKLVISNAGHALTAQTLIRGKPMLLLPMHGEQADVARRAVALGAAIAVSPHERHPKFARHLESLLDHNGLADKAAQFARRQLEAVGSLGGVTPVLVNTENARTVANAADVADVADAADAAAMNALHIALDYCENQIILHPHVSMSIQSAR